MRALLPPLTAILLFPLGICAQPLRSPAGQADVGSSPDSEIPLIFPAAGNVPAQETVQEAVLRLREEMRAIAKSSKSAAERKAALDEMLTRNSRVLKNLSTEWDDNRPRSADEAAMLLEQMIFELALAIAPDKDTRSFVKDTAPAHMEFEPNRPLLIAPRSHRQKSPIFSQPLKVDARLSGGMASRPTPGRRSS